MNVNFEKIDNVNANLSVAFVEDDYKSEVKKELAELGRKRPLKGFRPGHVPMSMLERVFGNQAKANVIDRKVGKALNEYIKDNKLRILGEPMLDPDTKVDIAKNKEFEFKFNLGLAPTLELPIDKNMTIPYYTIQVTQAMIDERNESFRKHYGKQVPGEVVADDSMVRGMLTELDDEGHDKADGIHVDRAVMMPQHFKDEAERDKIVGAHVGDQVVYNPYTAAGGSIAELASLLQVDRDKAEVKSNFRLDIEEVMVVEPAEMNQELFDQVLGKDEAKDEGEYFDKLRQSIVAQMSIESNNRFAIDASNELRKRTADIELPDEFLKRYLRSRMENATDEKVEQEYPAARNQLVWQFIRETAAEQLNVKIEDKDVNNTAEFMAARQLAQYGIYNPTDEMIENFAKSILDNDDYRRNVVDMAFDNKLFAAVKAAVTLDEKEVSLDDFRALYAQPAAAAE